MVFSNLQDNQFAKMITGNSWIVHLALQGCTKFNLPSGPTDLIHISLWSDITIFMKAVGKRNSVFQSSIEHGVCSSFPLRSYISFLLLTWSISVLSLVFLANCNFYTSAFMLLCLCLDFISIWNCKYLQLPFVSFHFDFQTPEEKGRHVDHQLFSALHL